jgi:hypothetical protein
MKYFQSLAVLALVAIIAACSGGGRSRVLGVQCPLNYNPVEMNIPNDQKLGLDTDLPPGDWEYAGGEFYFIDGPTDVRVAVRDGVQRNGEFKAGIYCLRNVKMGMSDLSVNTTSLGNLKVEGNQKITTFDAKRIGFTVVDTKIVGFTMAIPANEKPATPEKVYELGAANETFIYKVNDNSIEIRSAGVLNAGTYKLVIRLNKKPAAAAPEEAKPEEGTQEGQPEGEQASN